MRAWRFPDPSPSWLVAAREAYYRPRARVEMLAERVCRSKSGMAFFYRVRDRTRCRGVR
jgi:hypothetical protein